MASLTPSKRPLERDNSESNGRGKWHKTGAHHSLPKLQQGVLSFRILCPVLKYNSLVGEGGKTIESIRQESGAKITVDEVIPGCDERIVHVSAPEKDVNVSNKLEVKNEGDTDSSNNGEDAKDGDENKEQEDPPITDGAKLENDKLSVLKALVLVFERIVADDTVNEEENEGDGEKASERSLVALRLLLVSNQIGRILGKGGSVIKKMSVDSGSQIRVLPRDKLPLCSSPQDEILQMTGGTESVRKALQLVAQQLMEKPSRDRETISGINTVGSSFSFASKLEGFPRANFRPSMQGPPSVGGPFVPPDFHQNIVPPIPNFHDAHVQFPPEPITYRLFCSHDRVGSVIGKGGNVVKNIQHETNCEIKVQETVPESDDRIIAISGPAHPSDRVSPPQGAMMLVLRRLAMAVADNKEGSTYRILVSSNQTGSLLGKGGAIMADMRKISGAFIRILPKDQIPKGVPENDDVVQVTGELENAQEALMLITTRLKHHLFRNLHPSFRDLENPFGPYATRRDSSPSRLFPDMVPFQKEPFRPFGSGFPHDMDRPGPWAQPGMGDGPPMHMQEFPGGPPRNISGFSGPGQMPFVPNLTVEIVIPRSVVPSLYGEDGGCLKRIREFSEAKIMVADPRPDATETLVLISGAPDRLHAAQSLLQAFVLSEGGAS